jgi:hypothetical protein
MIDTPKSRPTPELAVNDSTTTPVMQQGVGAQSDPSPRDILHALLAHVFKRIGQFVPDVIAHCSRDTDTTRSRERIRPRCDVHPVAEDVVLLSDHVAEVDADAELDPPLLGHLGLAIGHPSLHLDRAPDGIHSARELCEETVAGILYDPAAVRLDVRIDQLLEMGLEPLVRPLLIRTHEARIPPTRGSRLDGGLRPCRARR